MILNYRTITSNKAKHLLVENDLKKNYESLIQAISSKSYFEEDDTQNYLAFQPTYRYFKRFSGVCSGNYIYFWKSKRLSDEKINSITTSKYSITPELSHYGTKTRVKFSGSCSNQDKVMYNHGDNSKYIHCL